MRAWRSLLPALALSFAFAAQARATDPDQPPFEVKDPASTENFRNAFLGIDQANVSISSQATNINVLVSSVTGNNAKLVSISTATGLTCIDSPTLCVDTSNHRAGVGTAGPSTLLHLSSGTLTIDGTSPGIAVGGSTFTVTSGVVSIGKQLRAGDGSASAPVLSFTNDTDTGFYRTTANEIRVSNGGSATWTFDGSSGFNATGSASHIYNSSGTAGSPAYSFSADSDSGMYSADNNELAFATGGVLKLHVSGGGHVYPEADNSYQCGISGHRWLQIWSANGTIQTSSSKLKKQIREIVVNDSTTTLVAVSTSDIPTTTFNAADDPEDVQVPRGIVFKWRTPSSTMTASADVIGFLGDDLPQEAHALKADGTRDPENFYTGAVVGIQSAAIRDLQRRVHQQNRQIRRLATIVAELEAQLNVAVPDPDPDAGTTP